MKKLALTLLALSVATAPALAAGRTGEPAATSMVLPAAANCHAVGEAKAAEVGGELARATPGKANGRDVCVVVVLVPSENGERPRRVEFVIPQ